MDMDILKSAIDHRSMSGSDTSASSQQGENLIAENSPSQSQMSAQEITEIVTHVVIADETESVDDESDNDDQYEYGDDMAVGFDFGAWDQDERSGGLNDPTLGRVDRGGEEYLN
ncbi:hypothetical protein BGZ76_002262 [Entomortierella beljakovae]|nr:hypothetical protein BGZ76_002262 [Entomortierella beljakovae]